MVTRNIRTASKPTPAQKPATRIISAKPVKKHKKEKKISDKVKVVRDSFTMPKNDYDLIATLKEKARIGGVQLKKSELLRAGLHLLSKITIAQLKKAVADLEKIKTGRPKKG